jgi:hypothetical protein
MVLQDPTEQGLKALAGGLKIEAQSKTTRAVRLRHTTVCRFPPGRDFFLLRECGARKSRKHETKARALVYNHQFH